MLGRDGTAGWGILWDGVGGLHGLYQSRVEGDRSGKCKENLRCLCVGTEADWIPLSRYGQGNTQRSICQPPAHASDDTYSLSHCEANTGLCLRTYMAYFNLISGLCRRAGPSRMVLSVHMALGGGTLRSFSLLCGITHELILPFRNNVDVRRRCHWCRACANALHPCRRWRRESWSLCLYHAMMRKRHQK